MQNDIYSHRIRNKAEIQKQNNAIGDYMHTREQLKHNARQRKHESPGKQCVFVQKRKRSIREAVVNISLMSCVPNEQKFVYIFQLHFARELKETGQRGWRVRVGNGARYMKCTEKETDRYI